MRRLLLVRHAATPATRTMAFPADEPLDQDGRTDAAALGPAVALRLQAAVPPHLEATTPPRYQAGPSSHNEPAASLRFDVLCSPAVRCLETAATAGLEVTRVELDLAECDFGTWAGRTLAEVSAADADAVAAWMADPAARPHGGESLIAFAARIAAWLDRHAALDGDAVAITHGGVVRAAVLHALDAPLPSIWRLDSAPLAITELHAHDRRWTVSCLNAAAPRIPVSPSPAPAHPLGAPA